MRWVWRDGDFREETGARGEGSAHKIKVHRGREEQGTGYSPAETTPMLPCHSCPMLNTYK